MSDNVVQLILHVGSMPGLGRGLFGSSAPKPADTTPAGTNPQASGGLFGGNLFGKKPEDQATPKDSTPAGKLSCDLFECYPL
jgi:hypothetical protein